VISRVPQSFSDTNTGALPQSSGTSCGIDNAARAVYYAFTPTETATYTATVSDYDWSAVMSLFNGRCGELVCQSTEGPCTDNCSFEISWTAVAGMTYYLVVSGHDGFSPDGPFRLNFEVRGIFRSAYNTRERSLSKLSIFSLFAENW
jgi:hypothetical protein